MNTISHWNTSLISRNEGKIKAYESCFDVRAWSHDVRLRDRYLREWIKRDMPICFMPVCTLTSFLKIMTCKNRGKTTPRCHPDCKSKILLESICTSCHVMKECLKDNANFDKYFEEEEFETSHWPCERCLDALKSIKIFWKIIIEKIFNINISKDDEIDIANDNCIQIDGVKSIAKVWEKNMVQQALFIRNVAPILKDSPSLVNTLKDIKHPLKNTTHLNDKSYNLKSTLNSQSIPKARRTNSMINNKKSRSSDTECNTRTYSNKSFTQKPSRKLSRSISVRVKTVDTGCSTYNIVKDNEELIAHKANLKYLQDKFNVHKIEIERLRQENLYLKCELQNSRKSQYWKSGIYTPRILNPDKNTLKSIENGIEVYKDSVKKIDSEMIITMKSCQNKNFKHVSLLQVLHKTNDPMTELKTNGSTSTKQDPINLLNKVQTTFGAIVKREMGMVGEKQVHSKRSDIEATFHRVNASKSAPSCSTISASSESNVSMKDMGDRVV